MGYGIFTNDVVKDYVAMDFSLWRYLFTNRNVFELIKEYRVSYTSGKCIYTVIFFKIPVSVLIGLNECGLILDYNVKENKIEISGN